LIIAREFANISFPDRSTVFLRRIVLRKVEFLCYAEEVKEIGIAAEAAKAKRSV
jgi:hypothetical protein